MNTEDSVDYFALQERVKELEDKLKDSVEVVRCKDCRWWSGSQETTHNNHLCRNWSKFGSISTSADDYCSYGERKTDDKETTDTKL